MTIGLPAGVITPSSLHFSPANTCPNFQPLLENLVIFLKAKKKISIAMTFTFIKHPLPNLLLHRNPQYSVAEL
jgi:hypothetical protein